MTDPNNSAEPTPPPPAYNPQPTAPPAYGQQQPYPGQQPYAAQQYPAAPPPAYGAPPSAAVPGRTLGIVAFVLSFFMAPAALIVGIIALVQSKKAGAKNGWAVAAIILSSVLIVLGVILTFAVVIPLVTFSAEALQACQAVDFTGTVTVGGIEVDCSGMSR